MEPSDLLKLSKLHCKDALDFALLAPKGYEDRRPSSELVSGAEGVVEIETLEFSLQKGRARGLAWLERFKERAELIIFHPSKYHHALFAPKERFFVKAKVERRFGKLILIQPQKLAKIGEILPKFSTKVLKNQTLIELASRVLSKESLIALGIPALYASRLCELFFPDDSFLRRYQQERGIPKEHQEALKFAEIFRHLRALVGKKRSFEALCRCQNAPWPFVDSLPFPLTSGQKEAIEAIWRDLSSSKAARRIIMGDVGCGKTLVILAAAYMAYPKQAVLMAPTTILAEQLYAEAKRFLPAHFKIALVMQERSSDSLEANLLIGTHALLYRKLDQAALVMIDEQHRFGTAQRSTLERSLSDERGHRPHVLQFSATPIPRTLAMIESNLIDFTFIRDIPFPKDITTRVIAKGDFPALLSHLTQEIAQGKQAAIIYPLVEESENLDYLSLKEGEAFWRKRFEGVYVTHGKDREKEAVLEEFREKGKILLATTVVEVGISLPKLSTIVIVGAERLGLATLHQLRGRVSRNGLKGYCFLYTHHKASKRLDDFASTLDGFEIAELDLKYRQGGDLVGGGRQSGESFTYFDPSRDQDLLQEAQAILNAQVKR